MSAQPGSKIVHLSSVHRSTDTRIFHKECRSLAQAGFDVTLIARAEKDTIADGIRIRALAPESENRIVRMTRSVGRVLSMALNEEADVYHFHDPELIPAGLLLRLRGATVVYDAHEDVSKQITTKSWLRPVFRKPVSILAGAIEQLGARFFTGIVAATPAIGMSFPPEKTVVITNYARQDEFAMTVATGYRERRNAIAYVGGITAKRGIVEMVDAMALLDKRHNAVLKLGGEFTPASLKEEVKTNAGWARVEHLGWLSRAQVAEVYAESRVGLLLFHPAPNHEESVPNKLFEYMASGLPIVASNFPSWRRFIERHECGIMVDPLDPRAIADAIQWLIDNPGAAEAMGNRGRDAALTHYTWESQAAKLIEFYYSHMIAR